MWTAQIRLDWYFKRKRRMIWSWVGRERKLIDLGEVGGGDEHDHYTLYEYSTHWKTLLIVYICRIGYCDYKDDITRMYITLWAHKEATRVPCVKNEALGQMAFCSPATALPLKVISSPPPVSYLFSQPPGNLQQMLMEHAIESPNQLETAEKKHNRIRAETRLLFYSLKLRVWGNY